MTETEATPSQDEMLAKTLDVALDVLECERGAIFLHDPATGELYTRHAEGLDGRELRIDPAHGLVGAAVRSGEIVNITDAYADPRFCPEFDKEIGYRTSSVLCA